MRHALDRIIRTQDSQHKLKFAKKALIRDHTGVSVQCVCDAKVPITGAVNLCEKCLTTFSGTGWIIEGGY